MSRLPLTPRGTGATLLGLLALILAGSLSVPALLFFGVLLLTVVTLSLVSLRLGHRPDRVRRTFVPEVVSVGDGVDVHARIECRTVLPTVAGTWRETLPAGIDGDATGVFPALPSGLTPGGHSIELRYRVTATRRGIRRIGPLQVTTTDPFGFARRTQRQDEPAPLTVAPSLIDLGPLEELPGSAGGSTQTQTDRMGQGADNLIPRVYVPGDSMRRIHWRASAHRGELMVRQEEQESNPEAVVVLDRSIARWSADALHAPGEDPAFELAVSAAASAVDRLVRAGYSVAIIDVDGRELAAPIDAGDAVALEATIVSFSTLTARSGGALADAPPLFAGAHLGPVVIVTGAVHESDITDITPITAHTSLPVLLTVGAAPRSLRAATAAGWRAMTLEPEDELARLRDQWADLTDRRVHVG